MLHYKTIEPSTLELLRKLQQLPELASTRLVGGTALALQLGHRTSVDLDLFGNLNISITELTRILADFQNFKPITVSNAILTCILGDVKVDVVNYKYNWLQEELIEDGIKIAGLEDIGAMKLSAITGRGSKKDFIDLYFLLQHFSLEQLFDYYDTKYPDGSKILVIKSLAYFSDADEDVSPFMFNPINWESIKKTISTHLKNFSSHI